MTRRSHILSFVVVASVWQVSCAKSLRGQIAVDSQHPHTGRDLQTARIVGGDSSSFIEFPFFVDLDGCGASLIWEDIVLTAAHCNVGLTSARVGPSQVSRDLVAGTVHPSYNPSTDSFDMMVLKLESPVSGVSTIDLNSQDGSPSNGDPLQVIGLGTTSEGGSPSNGLRKVTVNYIDTLTCNNLYGGGINDAMLCAGVDGGGKDSCQGDSGGAIFVGNTQVGVVSFGDGCARPDSPGVYARVSAEYDWIQSMICCHASNPPSNCGTVDENECPNDLGGGGGGSFDDDFGGFFDDDFGFDGDDSETGGGTDDDPDAADDDNQPPNTDDQIDDWLLGDDFNGGTDDQPQTDDGTDDSNMDDWSGGWDDDWGWDDDATDDTANGRGDDDWSDDLLSSFLRRHPQGRNRHGNPSNMTKDQASVKPKVKHHHQRHAHTKPSQNKHQHHTHHHNVTNTTKHHHHHHHHPAK